MCVKAIASQTSFYDASASTAMLTCDTDIAVLSVFSRSGVVSKWLNISSYSPHHHVVFLAGGAVRSHSDGQSPVCQCGDDARLMTVRKEGPNTGDNTTACSCHLLVHHHHQHV